MPIATVDDLVARYDEKISYLSKKVLLATSEYDKRTIRAEIAFYNQKIYYLQK